MEDEIRYAMANSRNNMEAARFLHIHHLTWAKYAKMYIDPETNLTLYEYHKRYGKLNAKRAAPNEITAEQEIKKILVNKTGKTPLKIIKAKLIRSGVLPEMCQYCGFHERRLTDQTAPLQLVFKDGNKKNLSLDNFELVCYNCYYLMFDDIFEKSTLKVPKFSEGGNY